MRNDYPPCSSFAWYSDMDLRAHCARRCFDTSARPSGGPPMASYLGSRSLGAIGAYFADPLRNTRMANGAHLAAPVFAGALVFGDIWGRSSELWPKGGSDLFPNIRPRFSPGWIFTYRPRLIIKGNIGVTCKYQARRFSKNARNASYMFLIDTPSLTPLKRAKYV